MKKLLAIVGLMLVGAGSAGCSYVTSANPGLQNATGESWYTKNKIFLIIPLGTDVYYCQKGGKCFLAEIR